MATNLSNKDRINLDELAKSLADEAKSQNLGSSFRNQPPQLINKNLLSDIRSKLDEIFPGRVSVQSAEIAKTFEELKTKGTVDGFPVSAKTALTEVDFTEFVDDVLPKAAAAPQVFKADRQEFIKELKATPGVDSAIADGFDGYFEKAGGGITREAVQDAMLVIGKELGTLDWPSDTEIEVSDLFDRQEREFKAGVLAPAKPESAAEPVRQPAEPAPARPAPPSIWEDNVSSKNRVSAWPGMQEAAGVYPDLHSHRTPASDLDTTLPFTALSKPSPVEVTPVPKAVTAAVEAVEGVAERRGLFSALAKVLPGGLGKVFGFVAAPLAVYGLTNDAQAAVEATPVLNAARPASEGRIAEAGVRLIEAADLTGGIAPLVRAGANAAGLDVAKGELNAARSPEDSQLDLISRNDDILPKTVTLNGRELPLLDALRDPQANKSFYRIAERTEDPATQRRFMDFLGSFNTAEIARTQNAPAEQTAYDRPVVPRLQGPIIPGG